MSSYSSIRTTALLALGFLACAASAQNLLRNPGFETVPDGTQGQGIMPSEWYSASSSPDTYSNDGSYGLRPSDYGDFTGVTAHGGLRWVAGAASGPESIGQILTSPLTAGGAYTASAYLHQAIRSDLSHPGGYDVTLTNANGSLRFDAGVLGYTASTAAWIFTSLSFVTPTNAASLDRIVYVPVSLTQGLDSYSGLDDVTLQAVPEPSALAALSVGALAFLRRRRL